MKIHTILKKIDQNGLWWKKLEHFEIGRPKVLRSKNLENFHWNFHWKLYENEKNEIEKFRFFSISKIFHFSYNFQWKNRKFFDLEKFRKIVSRKISDELFALTFFVFKFCWWFFFMDPSKFSVRIEWRLSERPVLQPEGLKREMSYWVWIRIYIYTYQSKSNPTPWTGPLTEQQEDHLGPP